MSVRRIAVLNAYAAAAATVALLVQALSCSSPAALQGQGGPCQQPSDCSPGLDCVPQANGTRICTNDLSSIVHTEEAGVEAATPKEAGGDGAMSGDSIASGDSGTPQDTGTPPQDTGSPPQDTGSPPQDTFSPPQDTGSPQDTSTTTDTSTG